MPSVFNAANEVAVELFLNEKIKFLDIYKIIEEAMNEHETINFTANNTLEEIENNLTTIKFVDKTTRDKVRKKWEK